MIMLRTDMLKHALPSFAWFAHMIVVRRGALVRVMQQV